MPQISVISFTVIRLRERWSSNSKNADWIALFVILVFAIAIHLFCVYTIPIKRIRFKNKKRIKICSLLIL